MIYYLLVWDQPRVKIENPQIILQGSFFINFAIYFFEGNVSQLKICKFSRIYAMFLSEKI